MTNFTYLPPATLKKSLYYGSTPAENFRLKTTLLLSGLGRISQTGAPKGKRVPSDFMTIPFQQATTNKIDHVIKKFPDYSRGDLDRFFKQRLIKNYPLHRNIFNELTNACGHSINSNQISCFLYVYRVIEQIALCLPIISIINKSGIQNTFTEFKQLIDIKAKSDLSVLKKYCKEHLDKTIADQTVIFDFTNTTRPKQNIDAFKRFVNEIVNETQSSIEIQYKNIDSLIIGFRNQFFHYLAFEKNLSITDLSSPDEFLKVCNPIFINFLGCLYYEFLSAELTMWA
jgi:hypothetical protein